MATHSVLQYSPRHPSHQPPIQRVTQPSPEKKTSDTTTIIAARSAAGTFTTEAGSPVKKGTAPANKVLDQQFDAQLGSPDSRLRNAVLNARHVQLPFSLLVNGRFEFPPSDEAWDQLNNLFPGTITVECRPPFLIIRVRKLPPTQPSTVAGVPVRFTTDLNENFFKRGTLGSGGEMMSELNLRDNDVTDAILDRVVNAFSKIRPKRIMWLGGFWKVVLPDSTALNKVPGTIGLSGVYYRYELEIPKPTLAALRAQTPSGVVRDTTNYLQRPGAILRPGIHLSSSRNQAGGWKTTTSGVLVTNAQGQRFITGASHGFYNDQEVWHPHPGPGGTLIGRVVAQLDATDISIIKLNPGITYENKTFQSVNNMLGTSFKEIASPNVPDTRSMGYIYMDNPFTGWTDGQVIGSGRVCGDGFKYVEQSWFSFKYDQADRVEGSCGSAIWKDDDKILCFLRWMDDEGSCFGIQARYLKAEFGYDIDEGSHTF